MTHKWIQSVEAKRNILTLIDKFEEDIDNLKWFYNEDYQSYIFTITDILKTVTRVTEVRGK